VEKITGHAIPVLGWSSIKSFGKKQTDLFMAPPFSQGIFPNYSTTTLFLFSDSDNRVVSFLSAEQNTLLPHFSWEVASSLSKAGKKILFVDSHFQNPQPFILPSTFEEKKGFGDFLSSDASFEQVCSPGKNGIDFVLPGKSAPNSLGMLVSKKMKDFVDTAKSRYDFIFFSASPLSLHLDGGVISSFCDSSFLVVSLGKTTKNDLRLALKNLSISRGKLTGVILFGATSQNSSGVSSASSRKPKEAFSHLNPNKKKGGRKN